jgi:subtilisin-like proprotein convertase family protein
VKNLFLSPSKAKKLMRGFTVLMVISFLLMPQANIFSTSGNAIVQNQVGVLSKEALTNRLIELEEVIKTLKANLAKGEGVQQDLDAAIAEYQSISSRLGGDAAPSIALPKKGKQIDTNPNVVGVVPTLPGGCTGTTSSFTQSTPVAIPTGPAVVTSTLVVSGAGPYLWDLDLTTFITHTFAADLDITITSPAGTVVTLTTDNGAGNDNVFNGTLWDDQANPGGQVPYTTNNGMVTDHAYVNLTLASPLTPEEPLGLFSGDDPNGTWTLTISDDLAGDGGSLDSWTLNTTTFPSAPILATNSYSQNTPVAIPTGPAVVTSTISVAGAPVGVSKVTLTTFITHTFAADLDITLTAPSGKIVTLTTDNGAGNDNVFNGTLWDDQANPGGQVPYTTNNGMVTDHAYVNLTLASPLTPEEPLGLFSGDDPNGTWTLTISDDLAGDGGSLDSWTLNITTATCQSCLGITCPANVAAVTPLPGQTTTVVTYPAPTTSGVCSAPVCSPASGSAFPVGTTTVTCTTDAPAQSCSFTVSVFNASVQDEYAGCASSAVFSTSTGEYRYCCNGTTYTGFGSVKKQGNVYVLTHNPPDRRVSITVDGSTMKGKASLQFPPATPVCTIRDDNVSNNTCICGAAPPPIPCRGQGCQ